MSLSTKLSMNVWNSFRYNLSINDLLLCPLCQNHSLRYRVASSIKNRAPLMEAIGKPLNLLCTSTRLQRACQNHCGLLPDKVHYHGHAQIHLTATLAIVFFSFHLYAMRSHFLTVPQSSRSSLNAAYPIQSQIPMDNSNMCKSSKLSLQAVLDKALK